MLTLGSLCDGIGGWLLAAERNGIKPIWSSEIDPAPASISRKHFPDVVQLGDLTKIKNPPHVDIVCAGSPCQNLSIAGNRKGLNGTESSLFFRAIQLVRRVRPKYFVWENVTGAFTSNKGCDFKRVLEEITESEIPMPKSGRWARAGMVRTPRCEVAWRTLDAQFWGVPQHRERVFLIADFTGQGRAEVLFKPESLSGNPKKSRKIQQKASCSTRRTPAPTIIRERAGKPGGGAKGLC